MGIESMEIGRSLAALLVVILLIGGLALVAKRWLPQLQAAGRLPTRRLKLVETMALDPRNRLAVVSIDGRELLIGVGANGPVLLDQALVAKPSIPRLGSNS